jgi:hypothetical protein
MSRVSNGVVFLQKNLGHQKFGGLFFDVGIDIRTIVGRRSSPHLPNAAMLNLLKWKYEDQVG